MAPEEECKNVTTSIPQVNDRVFRNVIKSLFPQLVPQQECRQVLGPVLIVQIQEINSYDRFDHLRTSGAKGGLPNGLPQPEECEGQVDLRYGGFCQL